MDLVAGVDGLRPEHGPVFAVVGVFDGLHLGHAYLLEHLAREAHARSARSCVITFDAHPDAVLRGAAPPLLLHPEERIHRLATSGVEVTVVQHFDEAVRRTPYDVFVATIQAGTGLAGLLMTPDAAFGFERRGTPETLAALGRERGFDVVVVPPFELDGRAVHSGQIRAAIADGDLATAARLLGRPVTLRGEIRDGWLSFDWPLALPPDGDYPSTVEGADARLTVNDGRVRLERFAGPDGPVEVSLST
jgi:riboflavin kinase/FMN adenylyltransferase